MFLRKNINNRWIETNPLSSFYIYEKLFLWINRKNRVENVEQAKIEIVLIFHENLSIQSNCLTNPFWKLEKNIILSQNVIWTYSWRISSTVNALIKTHIKNEILSFQY